MASLIWITYFSDWRQAQCWAGKDHKGSEQVIYFHFHINLYNTPHHTHFHFHTHFHSATHRLKFAGSSTSVSGVSLAGLLPPTSHLVTYQVLIKIMTVDNKYVWCWQTSMLGKPDPTRVPGKHHMDFTKQVTSAFCHKQANKMVTKAFCHKPVTRAFQLTECIFSNVNISPQNGRV